MLFCLTLGPTSLGPVLLHSAGPVYVVGAVLLAVLLVTVVSAPSTPPTTFAVCLSLGLLYWLAEATPGHASCLALSGGAWPTTRKEYPDANLISAMVRSC